MTSYIADELQPFLDSNPVTTWDLEAIRQWGEDTFAAPDMSGVQVHNCTIENAENRVVLRIITPPESRGYLYAIHGGGYTAGRAEFDDERNKELALRYSLTVVSPDYRLAPEHPFPAAPLDCLAGLEWVYENAHGSPVYVYGDSAGAGLAESCVCLAIDNGLRIDRLIMVEPAIDPGCDSVSMRTQENSPIWNKEKAQASWAAYLNGTNPDELPRLHNRMSTGLVPPILVFVNPIDCLRDEGIAWATELIDCGANLELHLLPGTYHGFLSAPGTITWSRVCEIIDHFLSPTT